MRCLSHNFIFKTEKCMKGAYKFMKKTRICYFCVRKLKHDDGFTEKILLKDDFYKKFISSDKDILETNHKNLLNTQPS